MDGAKGRAGSAVSEFEYEHVSIDRKHGFIRRIIMTSAAGHHRAQPASVPDQANTASDVRADMAYRRHH